MLAAPHAKTVIHPIWVRTTHWLNALAVVVMICSGWQIYNASPLFAFTFPRNWTLGGWLAGGIMWHFAAMWLLFFNGVIYLLLNLFSGRAAQKFWPVRPRQFVHDLVDAIKLRLPHQDPSVYNAVQRAAYLFVWVDLLILVCSGLVLWKSVQFAHLRELMGGYEVARRVHFIAMALLVAFILIHLVMVVLVPRSLVTMLRGR